MSAPSADNQRALGKPGQISGLGRHMTDDLAGIDLSGKQLHRILQSIKRQQFPIQCALRHVQQSGTAEIGNVAGDLSGQPKIDMAQFPMIYRTAFRSNTGHDSEN